MEYARNHTSATERYETWFGNFTEGRYDTVLAHFTAINNNTFAEYTFDCTCAENDVFAFVYPDTYVLGLYPLYDYFLTLVAYLLALDMFMCVVPSGMRP